MGTFQNLEDPSQLGCQQGLPDFGRKTEKQKINKNGIFLYTCDEVSS
jgi:hypothetical protein